MTNMTITRITNVLIYIYNDNLCLLSAYMPFNPKLMAFQVFLSLQGNSEKTTDRRPLVPAINRDFKYQAHRRKKKLYTDAKKSVRRDILGCLLWKKRREKGISAPRQFNLARNQESETPVSTKVWSSYSVILTVTLIAVAICLQNIYCPILLSVVCL